MHSLCLFPSLIFFFSSSCLDVCKCKARYGVKSNPPAPVYEEMAGVKLFTQKLAPRNLEETEYRNCSLMKTCPENHYESPRGALHPTT